MKTTAKHGGSRPGNPNGRRGGRRPGAGALVRRLHLDKETATSLRILTLHRRALTNNPELQPVNVATDLIKAAYAEYDAHIQHLAEQAHEAPL